MYALRVFALLLVVASAHGSLNKISRPMQEAQIPAHQQGLVGQQSKAYQRRFEELIAKGRAVQAQIRAERKRAAEEQRAAEERRAAEAVGEFPYASPNAIQLL